MIYKINRKWNDRAILASIAAVFIGFCYMIYTADIDTADIDTECHGTHVTGFSGGSYTSLCIENAPH